MYFIFPPAAIAATLLVFFTLKSLDPPVQYTIPYSVATMVSRSFMQRE